MWLHFRYLVQCQEQGNSITMGTITWKYNLYNLIFYLHPPYDVNEKKMACDTKIQVEGSIGAKAIVRSSLASSPKITEF